jgi:hypothetical protein
MLFTLSHASKKRLLASLALGASDFAQPVVNKIVAM